MLWGFIDNQKREAKSYRLKFWWRQWVSQSVGSNTPIKRLQNLIETLKSDSVRHFVTFSEINVGDISPYFSSSDLGINTAPSNRRWLPLLKIKYKEGGPPSLCLLGWPWGSSIRSYSNPAQLERTLLVKYIHFAQETENTSISIGFFACLLSLAD